MTLSRAGTAGQLPKPPDDVREAFFWEESIGSLDDEVSEALSRAFPCQLVTDFRLWLHPEVRAVAMEVRFQAASCPLCPA